MRRQYKEISSTYKKLYKKKWDTQRVLILTFQLKEVLPTFY